MQHNYAQVILKGPTNEKGNLFLGNISAAKPAYIYDAQIKAVITVARGAPVSYKDIEHMVIEADDIEDYQLSRHFHQTYDFIEKHLNFTNVLVHCFAGVSRSVTIVAAYLMKKHQMNATDAIALIQNKRPQAYPNQGFREQLEKYYTKL